MNTLGWRKQELTLLEAMCPLEWGGWLRDHVPEPTRALRRAGTQMCRHAGTHTCRCTDVQAQSCADCGQRGCGAGGCS